MNVLGSGEDLGVSR